MATSLANTDPNKFPRQIPYIVGNEACERFSYYGMRSVLVMFMTKYLMMDATTATSTYHLFMSACFLLPVLGAFISDRYWGKYRTIMWLSLVYCLGHAALSIWESPNGLYLGLALIAIGAGGIKPCVSAHVGDQFNEKNQHLLDKIFSIFYFSINFGAFFSTLLIPWLLSNYGSGVAFAVPGILMAIATFVFWMGRNKYVHVPPTIQTGVTGFMPILLYSLRNMSKKQPGQRLLDVARAKYSETEVEAAKAAADIFKVFITVSLFWALFDQTGSSWVLQAEKMDLTFMGAKLDPSQIQALNPILVMILIPLFTYGLYPAIEKAGIKVTALRKMSVGMVLAGFSFILVGMLQTAIDAGQSVNVAWQFLPYLVLTASEVMVSVTGLEFAYTQAPRSMKSTIMSFWFITVFVGNLLDAYVAKINVFQGAMFFYFFAALMLAVAMIFIFSATRYKVRSFIEKDSVSGTNGLAPAASPSG